MVALAAQVLFERSLNEQDISEGEVLVTEQYATNGSAVATHIEPFVPLPTVF